MQIIHVITIYSCICICNCITNVQRQGCTFHELFIPVLQYPWWSQLNTYDFVQQRYKEAIDSMHHLCNNIEPGTSRRPTVILLYLPFRRFRENGVWILL